MRKSNYFWFNLMCLSVSIFFLVGTVFIYVRNTFTTSLNQNSTIPLKVVNNVTIQSFNNENVSSTIEKVIEDKSLPKQYSLVVPFTSQAPEKNWDEPWQDACEEAALLMFDAYYKHYGLSPLFARDEILKMVKWEEEKNWGMSIEIEKVKEMAEEYFYMTQNSDNSTQRAVKIIEDPTVDDIKKSIVSGNPVLAVADGKVLPNPNFRNGGPVYHALVVKGYDEENFITNDPGTQFGESFKYKYHDLMNAIHDWNNGDVKNGRKIVLMLEY